jgi:ribosomal protein S11
MITFTKNNMIFTVCDVFGNVLLCNTSGICGFTHAKKKNFIAQEFSCLLTCRKVIKLSSIRFIILIFKNIYKRRRRFVRIILKQRLRVFSILEISTIAHNGCRLKKKQRR